MISAFYYVKVMTTIGISWLFLLVARVDINPMRCLTGCRHDVPSCVNFIFGSEPMAGDSISARQLLLESAMSIL